MCFQVLTAAKLCVWEQETWKLEGAGARDWKDLLSLGFSPQGTGNITFCFWWTYIETLMEELPELSISSANAYWVLLYDRDLSRALEIQPWEKQTKVTTDVHSCGLGGAVAYDSLLPAQWIFFFTKLQTFKILYRIPGSWQLNRSDTLSPLSPILLGSKIKGNLVYSRQNMVNLSQICSSLFRWVVTILGINCVFKSSDFPWKGLLGRSDMCRNNI